MSSNKCWRFGDQLTVVPAQSLGVPHQKKSSDYSVRNCNKHKDKHTTLNVKLPVVVCVCHQCAFFFYNPSTLHRSAGELLHETIFHESGPCLPGAIAAQRARHVGLWEWDFRWKTWDLMRFHLDLLRFNWISPEFTGDWLRFHAGFLEFNGHLMSI